MCTSRYAYQAPSAMLRARRKDANVRPNRWLDKKSSRGMLYENEELRLRTIEINAEVERGQGDIKKLKRQNEQLRREIWNLRDEYDKLEERMHQERMHKERKHCMQDGAEVEEEDYEEQEEEQELYEDEDETQIEEVKEKPCGAETEECGPEDADNMQNLIASAKLLGLREQGAGCEAEEVVHSATAPPSHELTREPRDRPDLLVLPAPLLGNAQPQTDSGEAIRRRTFGGEPAVTLHTSDARLSLPPPTELGATADSGDASDPRHDTTTECVTMPGYGQSLQPPISWPQHTPAWAITPFREPLPPNFGRRPPPPPPPKPSPSCEQVTTVRRASSVLPDGTTRRSVTFHADSIIYAPPTANALQVPAGGACSSPHSEGEDDDETTLVVRGLERVPGLGPRELIDALEQRLGAGELGRAVRAVCLHHQTVAATVSIGNRDMAMRLLTGGLEARGEPLVLEQEDQVISRLAADPSHVLLVSGVAHQVSDAAVRAAVARACGLRVNQVCRHVYKGVDTGERLVRVSPGSPTPLLQVSQAANVAEGESKFRTHLSVQLRRPGESSAPVAVVQEQPRAVQPAGVNTQTSGQCTAPPSPQCNGPVSPPPYTPPPAVPLRRPSTVVQSVQQQRIEPHRESATDCPAEAKPPANSAGRKKASQNGGILRGQDAARRVAKSRSVSVESSARAPPQRRRLGVVERPSSEELQLPDEPIARGPALPWCACWGNGCI